MTDMTIGQRISECRRKLGISQEALGEKVGVSRQAISKWESDGALPEIDKLIALSKLFDVSIGWLLGVEEQPTPEASAPPISEELLRKIEEIVLRYRPRKEKMSTKKKWAIGIAAALVLLTGYHFLTKWETERSMLVFTYAQVDAINEQNANIQHQLNDLANRIDGINANIETVNASLASYEFHITPDLNDQTAQVVLNAIPKTWSETLSAALTVRKNGQHIATQACSWDGTGFTGKLTLDMADGYEYWFAIGYPDGTQEQIRLEDALAQTLKSSYSIDCQITAYPDAAGSTGTVLELSNYDIYLARPDPAYDKDAWVWTQAEFVLYRNHGTDRSEVGTYSILNQDGLYHDGKILGMTDVELWGSCIGEMVLPALSEGDGMELWFRAALANGTTASQKVDSWTYSHGALS